ncbi:MAG: hypothetical protein KZQ83_17055 [gamma proteobacterium symbiont of Taylorina sp.]|nr:hypothetical protein [gamma proteobacterium symbiont of Taylorina sp.]
MKIHIILISIIFIVILTGCQSKPSAKNYVETKLISSDVGMLIIDIEPNGDKLNLKKNKLLQNNIVDSVVAELKNKRFDAYKFNDIKEYMLPFFRYGIVLSSQGISKDTEFLNGNQYTKASVKVLARLFKLKPDGRTVEVGSFYTSGDSLQQIKDGHEFVLDELYTENFVRAALGLFNTNSQ